MEWLDQLQTSPYADWASTSVPGPEGAVPRHAEPRLYPPAPYWGEPNSCRSFLSQCLLILALQPSCFPTELSRVAYIITLLVGQAREWGTAVWDGEQACCESFEAFSEELCKVFDHSSRGIEAARGGTSPRSPYPVAGTRRHSGITSSMAWLSTLRTRSIPWSFQLAWKVDRSRYQGRFLSVSGTEEGDFSASASRVPPRQ